MEQFERMKIVVVTGILSVAIAVPAAAQTTSDSDKVAQAYAQFLIGRHLAETDLPIAKKADIDGAIAAYKRAIDLDPASADATAELAALYLRQNKIQDAM